MTDFHLKETTKLECNMFTYRFESLQKWVWLRRGRGLTRKRLNRWFDLLLQSISGNFSL